MSRDPALVLLGALLVDRFLGEPPVSLHPVAWMGKLTDGLMRYAPPRGALAQLAFGLVVALAVPALSALATWALLAFTRRWPPLDLLAAIYLLKASFSLEGLLRAGRSMQQALQSGLPEARAALSQLCSRDPSSLEAPELVGATVESLAENTSDSVVAPLLWYACFGLEGAVTYRAVNTLDAMIGYHGRYEHLGKVAARVDDLLNLVPARLTALLLLLSGALSRARLRGGVATLLRDRAKTESPNAGWPMATMAGLLGVALDKRGHYRLGDAVEPLSPRTIERAMILVAVAGWLFAALLLAAFAGLRA